MNREPEDKEPETIGDQGRQNPSSHPHHSHVLCRERDASRRARNAEEVNDVDKMRCEWAFRFASLRSAHFTLHISSGTVSVENGDGRDVMRWDPADFVPCLSWPLPYATRPARGSAGYGR